MITRNLHPSLFQRCLVWLSARAVPETGNGDATDLDRRAFLSEMMSRNPEAFGSDLDVLALMSEVRHGY